ncbi:nicotinamide-nucleotide amidohydrolase family protein [uncultured Bifidobacterium sp.]|uniref:CinA family protein n=1 Tax=uncultured Bifidobacterium sp. TaxID=165187 RepID=UPI0028DC04F3|nr:nicotinamide-nucleotide amidohydrolase family protein [uncultured Bifidobacterium sp.]
MTVTPSSGRSDVPAWLESGTDEAAAAILRSCRCADVLLAASESLTGGLVSDAFVRIPGASDVFLGSAVTYDVAAKASVLGVDEGLLSAEGAVRPVVARQMALGAALLFGRPHPGVPVIGLSTTGVAGPGPDGRGNPQGLAYAGVFLPDRGGNGVVLAHDPLAALRDVERGLSADAGVRASLVGSDVVPAIGKGMGSAEAVPSVAADDGMTPLRGRIDVLRLRSRGSREEIRRRTVFVLLRYVSHLTAPWGE